MSTPSPYTISENITDVILTKSSEQPQSDSGMKSHATGESYVPEAVQKVAPEVVEKVLPESVHPTKGSDIDPDPSQNSSVKK